ncbi:MAG: FAD-dependent oxidoreductase, partial [Burkholderiaceae bacterium]|nr:FAD-dependent oxidoreductase [Burkholderiaceae bacterium]
DARRATLMQVYIADVALDPAREAALLQRHAGHPHIGPAPDMRWQPPVHASATQALRPVVVGFGPCGIFAALVLAQMGFRPIVLERGRAVRERTKDTWGLWRKKVLNPESNVQFGEGGAGTFSDGKLYSQIKDPRHLGRKVMNEFVQAGAPPDILYEAHPHIGTFKLVKVVESLRAQIIALGGEVRFQQRVTGLRIEDAPGGRRLRGLEVTDAVSGEVHELQADHVVMALGHSARDTFEMLHAQGVYMEAKPFSIGFRIEHPQSLIDRARWGRHAGHPLLGAADYRLVHHAANGRSVYSFCMCPGGTVVAATSEPQRVVTNGMSQYSRNERNANAGIVVGITPEDYPGGPLAGIELQRALESQAFVLGGGDYEAPGQRVGDFLAGQPSSGPGS